MASSSSVTFSKSSGLTPNHEAAVELLDQYIEAAANSASRARTILIVIITASVLTFVAYWNTRSDAWLTGRIDVATAALRLFDPATKGRLPDDKAIDFSGYLSVF